MCRTTRKLRGKPRQGQVQFTQLVAKQTSMIKPNKAKQIRNFLKDPHAQHRPNTSCHSQVSTTLYLGPEPPPCQAPGLCSFLADVVAPQVNAGHGFVDLQRFGEGLWPKRWQARRLMMRSTRTFVTPVKLLCHGHARHQQELK